MPSRVVAPESFIERVEDLRKAPEAIGRELMPELERLAWQDNRDGLLAGLDRDGRPFAPLARSTLERRKGTGPPLIPRRNQSRMIANYRVGHARQPNGGWVILGFWENVLSTKGVPFVKYFIDGTKRMPRRDPDGIRPAGKRKISAAMQAWLRERWSKP